MKKFTAIGSVVLASVFLLSGCSAANENDSTGVEFSSQDGSSEIVGTPSEKLFTVLKNSNEKILNGGVTEEATKDGVVLKVAYDPAMDKSVMFGSGDVAIEDGNILSVFSQITGSIPDASSLGNVEEDGNSFIAKQGDATATFKISDGLVSEFTMSDGVSSVSVKVIKYGLTEEAVEAFKQE